MTEPRTDPPATSAGRTLVADLMSSSKRLGPWDINAAVLSIEAEAGALDAAWKRADVAWPGIPVYRLVLHETRGWEAVGKGSDGWQFAYGPTPTDALNALADALEDHRTAHLGNRKYTARLGADLPSEAPE